MDVVKEYIVYIKNNKKLSDNTILSYYNDIKKYIDYMNHKELKLENIAENDIIGYLIELEKVNSSVSSISRMISSIKSFHEYLFINRLIEKNVAINIKKPKVVQKNIDMLTEEEIKQLLDFKKLDTPKLIRDKAIFEVLYGTGIKVSELIDLNVEDINLDLEYICCNTSRSPRIIPITDITKLYLEKYVNESRQNLVCDYNEQALFVSSLGLRFTRQGLWKLIKKYAVNVNIKKNITPTILRHSFAMHLLNEGANIHVVSKILGNTNISSLQVYIEHINQNMRKEIKEKHPRQSYGRRYNDE